MQTIKINNLNKNIVNYFQHIVVLTELAAKGRDVCAHDWSADTRSGHHFGGGGQLVDLQREFVNQEIPHESPSLAPLAAVGILLILKAFANGCSESEDKPAGFPSNVVFAPSTGISDFCSASVNGSIPQSNS